MSFTLKIETDNEAFASGPEELVRLLRLVANRVAHEDTSGWLADINGNRVGEWDSAAP
jgi:hypothetical protein